MIVHIFSSSLHLSISEDTIYFQGSILKKEKKFGSHSFSSKKKNRIKEGVKMEKVFYSSLKKVVEIQDRKASHTNPLFSLLQQKHQSMANFWRLKLMTWMMLLLLTTTKWPNLTLINQNELSSSRSFMSHFCLSYHRVAFFILDAWELPNITFRHQKVANLACAPIGQFSTSHPNYNFQKMVG